MVTIWSQVQHTFKWHQAVLGGEGFLMLFGFFKSHIAAAVTIGKYFKILMSSTIGSVATRQYDFQAWKAVFLFCSWDSFLKCGVEKGFVGRVGLFYWPTDIDLVCLKASLYSSILINCSNERYCPSPCKKKKKKIMPAYISNVPRH